MNSVKYLSACLALLVTAVLINAAPGAGGLPYATNTDTGRVCFLVGLDSHVNEWADFGGGAKFRETVAQTGAREFSEETRDVFGKGSRAQSTQFFKDNIKFEALHPKPGSYHMFLIQATYIPERTFNKAPDYDREKSDYEWIDAENFLNSIQQNKTLGAPFSFQGKRFRDFVIDTIRYNLSDIRNIVLQRPAFRPPIGIQPAPSYHHPAPTLYPQTYPTFVSATPIAEHHFDQIVAMPASEINNTFYEMQELVKNDLHTEPIGTMLNITAQGKRLNFSTYLAPNIPMQAQILLKSIGTEFRTEAEQKLTPQFLNSLQVPRFIWFTGLNAVKDPNRADQILIIATIGDELAGTGFENVSANLNKYLGHMHPTTSEAQQIQPFAKPQEKLPQHIRIAKIWLTKGDPEKIFPVSVLSFINTRVQNIWKANSRYFTRPESIKMIEYHYFDNEKPPRILLEPVKPTAPQPTYFPEQPQPKYGASSTAVSTTTVDPDLIFAQIEQFSEELSYAMKTGNTSEVKNILNKLMDFDTQGVENAPVRQEELIDQSLNYLQRQ